MKLKRAFMLSLIANAIFVVAVSYMAVIEIKPLSSPPAFIFLTNAPSVEAGSGDLALAPQ